MIWEGFTGTRGLSVTPIASNRGLDLCELVPKVGKLEVACSARGQLGKLKAGVAQQLPDSGIGLQRREQVCFLGEPVVLDDLIVGRLLTGHD